MTTTATTAKTTATTARKGKAATATDTAKTPVVPVVEAPSIDALIKAFNKETAVITRASNLIEKQKGIIREHRALTVRIFAQIMDNPAMHLKNGKVNFTAIANDLVLSKDVTHKYKDAVQLVQDGINAKTITIEETPGVAEQDAANFPWDNAAELKRAKREAAKAEAEKSGKGGESEGEGTGKDSRDSKGDADIANLALSPTDIIGKAGELLTTVDMCIKSGVTLTDAEHDTINAVMAELMVKLDGMHSA